MSKFLVINRPRPHRAKDAPVGQCVGHFINLDMSGKAKVYPIAGLKGYATLVEVDSHEELKDVLMGNSMCNIEEYTVLALGEVS